MPTVEENNQIYILERDLKAARKRLEEVANPALIDARKDLADAKPGDIRTARQEVGYASHEVIAAAEAVKKVEAKLKDFKKALEKAEKKAAKKSSKGGRRRHTKRRLSRRHTRRR